MESKTNYKVIEQEVLSEVETDKDENNEVPMFVQFPESAPIEPVKAGKLTMILPWCC